MVGRAQRLSFFLFKGFGWDSAGDAMAFAKRLIEKPSKSNGRFARWPLSEQLVALGIVSGLAWLLFRSNVAA
jgi:hypothetical protein